MAIDTLLPPPKPALTDPPRTRWIGTPGPGLPLVSVLVRVHPGFQMMNQPTGAKYRSQYRFADGDTPLSDWQPVPDIEATDGTVEIPFPEVRFDGDLDLRIFAISVSGVPSEPLVYLRHPTYNLQDAPASVSMEPISQTDALGTKTGIRATWEIPDGLLAVVSYKHMGSEWTETAPRRERFYDIVPATAAGVWQVMVRACDPNGNPGPTAMAEWAMQLGTSPYELRPPSGLEIVGPRGELLGSEGTITTRDLWVRWHALRVDALEVVEGGVGMAPADELLTKVVIRVYDGDEVVREDSVPIEVTGWTYTYGMNVADMPIADFGLTRTVRLQIAYKDVTGRFSSWVPIVVTQTLGTDGYYTTLDDSSLDQTTAPLAYTGAFTQIAVQAWTAASDKADVTWQERSAMTVSVSSAQTVGSQFRFTVRDMTAASNVFQETFENYSALGFAAAHTKNLHFPSVRAVVTTVPGHQYEARMEWARTRSSGGDTINLVSTHRMIAVQEKWR